MKYDNESIKSLKGADRVRLRPSVIFGSDGVSGAAHTFFEILSNSIDEARMGFGSVIEVARLKDKSIRVADYGRGTPVDYNIKEGRENWELLFCELYAGGKYDEYSFSLGLNGLGLCATQYASRFMEAEIKRDGFLYKLRFERGKNVGGLYKEKYSGFTGTVIRWLPDDEVFTDIDIPLSYFTETLKRQAIVNKNLKFVLFDEESGESFTYFYKNGAADYMKEKSADDAITQPALFEHETKGRDREDLPDYKVKFEIAFYFCEKKPFADYYCNGSWLERGGSPEKAARSGFLHAVDNYLKRNGLYKKDEKKITFADIEESLALIINVFSTAASYENQTKKAVTNVFIKDAITEFLRERAEIYFIENKAEAEKIAARVLINKRGRETAERARTSAKKTLSALGPVNRVEKFVDCRSKDVEKRELYIVEGDSALGACKLARDAAFQAIMPVRGKILNCLKSDRNKILKSEIITDLIKVLGCGIELKKDSFDINNLRWSKVIICTDADVDGFQIRTLVLAMLYVLTPALITEKKVFIAESPLYEITSAKKTYFAYSDAEKNRITKGLKSYQIQRSKGLGQNEPQMMWETTMCPETRKLILVAPEEPEKMKYYFDLLLGGNLKGRKKYIEEYGRDFLDETKSPNAFNAS